MLFKSDKIVERWKEFVEELFYRGSKEKPIYVNSLLDPSILKADQNKNTLQTMSKRKAVGIDLIMTEMLVDLGNFDVDIN